MTERKCHVCGESAEPDFDFCWNCSSPLDLSEEIANKIRAKKESSTNISCIRCQTKMRYAGLKKFHEGTRGWAFWLGEWGELFVNREFYDVYVCPRCGKVELFLDGIGDKSRPEG